jgi:hypothetical protein
MTTSTVRRWGFLAASLLAAIVLLGIKAPPAGAAAQVNVHRLKGPFNIGKGKGLLLSLSLGSDQTLANPISVKLTFRNANGGAINNKTVQLGLGTAASKLTINAQGQIFVDGDLHGGLAGDHLPILVEITTRVPRTLPVCASVQVIDADTEDPEFFEDILVSS